MFHWPIELKNLRKNNYHHVSQEFNASVLVSVKQKNIPMATWIVLKMLKIMNMFLIHGKHLKLKIGKIDMIYI